MLNKLILYENECLNNSSDNFNEHKEIEIILTLKSSIYMGIKINGIIFIEAKGRNCEMNTINGIYIPNNMVLTDCQYILQIHRSFAINKNCICKIEKLDVNLGIVYFNQHSKTALLGYKFKDTIISEFKKGKVIIC